MRRYPFFFVLVLAACGGAAAPLVESAASLESEEETEPENAAERCLHLDRAFVRTSNHQLPQIATHLLANGCDQATACANLLQTRLPAGDAPGIDAAVNILTCLQPVSAGFLVAAPAPVPLIMPIDPPPLVASVLISSFGVFSVGYGGGTFYPVFAADPFALPSSAVAAVKIGTSQITDGAITGQGDTVGEPSRRSLRRRSRCR